MTRTANYYRTRTVVRFVFWWGVAFAFVFGGRALAGLAYGDPTPCPVTLTPGKWAPEPGRVVDVTTCQHPDGITLAPGGTWTPAP